MPNGVRRRATVAGQGPALVAVLAAALVAACGSTAPGPSSTPAGASAPASPAASAPTMSPGQSSPPAVSQRFVFAATPILTPQGAGTDDKYVNPGAVIEVDGVLHMFPNLFSDWPGRVRVPHLTSEDGRTWVLDEAAAGLDSEDLPMADPGIDVSTGYLADDGTWVLYFQTVQKPGLPWEIWRATARTPQGPWTISEEPVLSPGATGAFDDRNVIWPVVVRIGDRWAMYYTGVTGSGRGIGSIGLAFSDDGIAWTKHPEPVIVASEAWEFGSVDRPRAVVTPDGLVMVYAGQDLTNRGLATSTDGITWTKLPGPNIERSDFPLAGGSWDAALLLRGGELEYFLEIGTQTTKVYRATLPWP